MYLLKAIETNLSLNQFVFTNTAEDIGLHIYWEVSFLEKQIKFNTFNQCVISLGTISSTNIKCFLGLTGYTRPVKM